MKISEWMTLKPTARHLPSPGRVDGGQGHEDREVIDVAEAATRRSIFGAGSCFQDGSRHHDDLSGRGGGKEGSRGNSGSGVVVGGGCGSFGMGDTDRAPSVRQGGSFHAEPCRRREPGRSKPCSLGICLSRSGGGGEGERRGGGGGGGWRRKWGLSSIVVCVLAAMVAMACPTGGTDIPAPVDLTAENYGDVTVRLEWDAPYGWSPSLSNSTIDKWVTWRSTSPNSGYTIMDSSLLGPISFKVVSALQAGTRYYFRVETYSCCNLLRFAPVCSGVACTGSATSHNAGSTSTAYPLDGYAQVDIVAKTVPTAPTAAALTIGPAADGYPGTSSVGLSWQLPLNTGAGTSLRSVDDVLNFRVMRSTNAGFSGESEVYFGLPTRTGSSEADYTYAITDDGLTPGTTYYYRIQAQTLACNPVGFPTVTCGAWGDTSMRTVGRPGPVSNAASVLNTAQSVTINWGLPDDTGMGNGGSDQTQAITGYFMYITYCEGPPCTPSIHADIDFSSSNGSLSTHTFTGLTSARTYQWDIQAINVAGSGAVESITQITLFLPTPPQLFSAVVSESDGPLKIRLSWSIPDNTGQGPGSTTEPIVSYMLLMDDSDGTFSDPAHITTLQESLTPLEYLQAFDAARAAPYYFLVIASNMLGHGAYATNAAFASEQSVALPTAPQSLSATVTGVKTIALSWSPPADTGVGGQVRALTQYLLQRSDGDDSFTSPTDTTLAGDVTALVVTVPNSGPSLFYFRVLTANSAGSSLASNSASEQGVDLPGAPASVAAATPTAEFIGLTWALPVDTGIGGAGRAINNFIVETYQDGTLIENVTLAGDIFSRDYSDLDHLSIYSFSIYAINDAGTGTDAGTASAQPAVLPTAPVGLTATVDSPLEILLAWSYPTDTGRGGTTEPLISFKLERGDDSAITTPTLISDDLAACTGTSCSVRVQFSEYRLEPYFFRVRATNYLGLGPGIVASEQSVALPTAPQSPTVAVAGPLTLLVQWSAPVSSGVGDLSRPLHSYTLQRSHGDDSFPVETTVDTVLSSTTTSQTIIFGAASSTLYYFRVFTTNDAGDGALSDVASEQSVALPTKPLNLQTVINGPLAHSITWDPPADTGVGAQDRPLLSQHIEVRAEDGGSTSTSFATPLFLDKADLGPTVQTYDISGLVQGKVYFVRITAVNDAGTGPSSDTAYEEAVALPTAPTSFAAVVTAELTIDLTWAVPADTGFLMPDMSRVTTFVLEQSETSTFDVVSSNLLETPSTPTALSRIVAGLTKGTTYYYRIYTENVAGRSTTYAAANEQAITVPNAPTITAEITGELEVRFTWVISTDTGLGEGVTPPRPITGYVLQITEEPTPPSANPTFSTIYASYNEGISATTRTMSGLGKGNTYFARILASNDAGSGPYSDTDNKQALTRPSPPNVTTVIPDGFNLLSVSFIPPPDTGLGAAIDPPYVLGDYRLQYALNDIFTSGAVSVSLGNTTLDHVISGLPSGNFYYVRVFASNILGESEPSGFLSEHSLGRPSQPRSLSVSVSPTNELELLLTWQFPADSGLGGQACQVNCTTAVTPAQRELTTYRLQRLTTTSPADAVVAGTPQSPPSGVIDFTGADDVLLDPDSLTLVESSMTKGTTYYYRIFASTSAGEGFESVTVFEMAITKPSPVLNPTVSIAGELLLDIAWDPPSDLGNGDSADPKRPLLSYTLYIVSNSNGVVVPQIGGLVEPISFSSSEVYPGTGTYTIAAPTMVQGVQYDVYLVAHNSAGDSPASVTVSETAILKPTAPIVSGTIPTNPGEVTYKWFKPSDTGATGQEWLLLEYEVEMAENAAFTSGLITIFKNGTNNGVPINDVNLYTVVQPDLQIGDTYYFRTFAYNQAGKSPASNVVFQMVVSLPGHPENLRVSITAPLELTLIFDKPLNTGTGGQAYAIDRYILELKVDNSSFADSVFPADGCYHGRVPPCDVNAESVYDLGVQGSSGVTYRANCPKLFDPIAKCTRWPGTMSASETWTMRLHTLQKAKTYYFRVFAKNSAGISLASPTVFEQGVDLPSAPRDFTLTLQGNNEFALDWEIPADTGVGDQSRPITKYLVFLAASESRTALTFFESNLVLELTETETVLVDGVSPPSVVINLGTRYWCRAVAVNDAGRGAPSNVETNGPTFEALIPGSAPARGGSLVTITGSNLGNSIEILLVKMGPIDCLSIAFLVPQRVITCEVPPGAAGIVDVFISVAGLFLTQYSAFRYDSPTVASVTPREIETLQGGGTITIAGLNFGGIDTTPVASISGAGSRITCETSLWISDSSVTCTLPAREFGAPVNNSVLVRVGAEENALWEEGSLVRYINQPGRVSCPRSTTDVCIGCCMRECLADTLEGPKGQVGEFKVGTLSCDDECLNYCGYAAPSLAVPEGLIIPPADYSASLAGSTHLGDQCNPIPGSTRMEVTVSNGRRLIASNACPGHAAGGDAEAQELYFDLPAYPKLARRVPFISLGGTPIEGGRPPPQGTVGVAVNGVPLANPIGRMYEDSISSLPGGVDACGGSVDAVGMYTYLGGGVDPSICATRNAGEEGKHSPLLGYMLDGVPIYGHNSAVGVPPNDLDECGGHVDTDYRGIPFYHYHTREDFPYLPGCLRGCVDVLSSQAVNLDISTLAQLASPCIEDAFQHDYESLAVCHAGQSCEISS